MRLEFDKKEMKDALKNVELKGKWSVTGGLSSKSLGKYIQFQLQDNRLIMFNADESTVCGKSISVDCETEEYSFILELDTLKKYLDKMSDSITLDVGTTVVMQSGGKRATMPMVVRHPFEGRIERLINQWPLSYNENLEELLSLGEIKVECGVQVTGAELQESLDACEIVNNGIYKLDFKETDDLTDAKFVISSEEIASSYREEMAFSNNIGESATVVFSGPLHKFFNKDDKINIFIGDNQPIIMVTENSALIRAPRLGV